LALVTTARLLEDARRGGYAVGAFNANNLEIVQAIVEGAREEGAAVIIQASQGAIKYAGIEYITAMVRAAAEGSGLPIALHLDHGTDFGQVMRCIRHGFTSVMIDGSALPFEENVALTAKVVEVAHAVGVSVEGELGRIGGTEDDVSVSDREATLTDPEEARRFVELTGVDSLAVAIGTAHGFYRGKPQLDFARLREIRDAVDVPLVLHGASGVPDEDVRRAISLGIAKINIDTELRHAFVSALRARLEELPTEIDPRKLLAPAREAMKEKVREKIRTFGQRGSSG